MLRYLLKRLLIFIPTLIAISLLAFGLSKLAPGDPVEQIIGAGPAGSSLMDRERAYAETAALLGLDKPVFYFALSSQAYPDTLHRIADKDERRTLRKLIAQYGNWVLIQNYYRQLQQLEQTLSASPDTTAAEAVTTIRAAVRRLYLLYREPAVQAQLDKMEEALIKGNAPSSIRQGVREIEKAYQRLSNNSRRYLLYIPDLKWYGLNNQYHDWFTGMLAGDFGTSYIDGRPVADKVTDALRWTLLLNGLAVFFAFAFSIPLGVYAAVHRHSRFDRLSSVGLFMLYSLPQFWIATLLVVFVTTPEYGLDWFPTMGVGETDPEVPLFTRILDRAYHLVLPVFCLTYGSLAFITRQMRSSMIETLQQDYARTAKAKGLSAKKIIWRHAFRNALFPIITLFGSVFPAVLAGSVVIEVIFNIYGMGKLTVDAIFQRDWPVVYAVLMLGAFLTMAGILLADVLYAVADPRVRYGKGEGG